MTKNEITNILDNSFKGLTFIEDTHTYLDPYGNKLDSVTGVVHSLGEPFDSDLQATKYAIKHGMTKEAVLKKWDENSKRASSYGTLIHLYIEEKCKGNTIELDYDLYPELKEAVEKFDNFYSCIESTYIPIKNEYKIFDTDFSLAGTIDGLFYNDNTEELCIFDWKTSKTIVKEGFRNKTLIKFPKIQDCNYSHYAFQLGIYKYLLEKNTGLKISNMNIIQISILLPKIKVWTMPYYEKEIEQLLQERK